MRGESRAVEVPPEVHAEAQHSEHEAALESERLESLISTLRRRATGRDLPASRQAGAFQSARLRAAREMLGEGLASG